MSITGRGTRAEYLALIQQFRLIDDTFFHFLLRNADKMKSVRLA